MRRPDGEVNILRTPPRSRPAPTREARHSARSGRRHREEAAMRSTAAVTSYMTQHLESSRSFLTLRATRAASVKASLTPLLRMAEHSR